jgi:hypothetical protein
MSRRYSGSETDLSNTDDRAAVTVKPSPAVPLSAARRPPARAAASRYYGGSSTRDIWGTCADGVTVTTIGRPHALRHGTSLGQADPASPEPGTEMRTMPNESTPAVPLQSEQDNRSRQLNVEHDAYWRSRGHEGRPTEGQSRPDVGRTAKR